ncbi:hypothetical protein BDN70DRAFT_901855, partial [Pholiota conissans]
PFPPPDGRANAWNRFKIFTPIFLRLFAAGTALNDKQEPLFMRACDSPAPSNKDSRRWSSRTLEGRRVGWNEQDWSIATNDDTASEDGGDQRARRLDRRRGDGGREGWDGHEDAYGAIHSVLLAHRLSAHPRGCTSLDRRASEVEGDGRTRMMFVLVRFSPSTASPPPLSCPGKLTFDRGGRPTTSNGAKRTIDVADTDWTTTGRRKRSQAAGTKEDGQSRPDISLRGMMGEDGRTTGGRERGRAAEDERTSGQCTVMHWSPLYHPGSIYYCNLSTKKGRIVQKRQAYLNVIQCAGRASTNSRPNSSLFLVVIYCIRLV